MAVCARPESAGPGQVATLVHSSLMPSPQPSLPPSGAEGHLPVDARPQVAGNVKLGVPTLSRYMRALR